MTLGAASNQEVEEIEKAIEEEDDTAAAARRGQILWVRGLNRLQHQVRLIHLLLLSLNVQTVSGGLLPSKSHPFPLDALRGVHTYICVPGCQKLQRTA